MADPTTPTDPAAIVAPNEDQLAKWDQYNTLTATSGYNMGQLSNVTSMVNDVFRKLTDGLDKLGVSFESLDTMTPEISTKFGMLTTSILGSKEAFTALNADVDATRLVTFSGQLNQLFEIIKKGPGTSMAADAIEKIMDSMKKAGASGEVLKAAYDGLKKGTVAVADAFFQSADNTLRLQNSMVQMTIASGNARDLFQGIPGLMDGVGEGFENIGIATDMYTKALERGTAALGGNRDLAARYMSDINRMPGGFKALIAPLEVAGNSTDILTASIEYAVGAGRKQEDVFKDMSKAMTEYNVTGGEALRFSARMTEVADAVGAQFQDVQSALGGAIDEFKMFVSTGADAKSMTQGMADAMRSYVSELTNVGVPAQNAIEMFKTYTATMKNMSIGQSAFISQMSGGAGGLRGAFQMDALVRQGKFEEIRQKVESTIKKMTGPIVSLEDAQKSESAAAQYTKQIQLLQQGPLGALAKTRPEAEALLQAMKEGKKIPTTGKTAEQTLSDTMNRGLEWQKGSYTELQKVNVNLVNLQTRAGVSNLATAQTVLTPAGGRTVPGGSPTGAGISPGAQERLLAGQRTIATSPEASTVFKQMGEVARNLPKTVQDAWKSLQEVLKGGNRESIQQANEKMLAAIKDQKAAMTDAQKAALATATNAAGQVSDMLSTPPATGTTTPTTRPGTTVAPTTPPAGVTIGRDARRLTFTPTESYAPAGRQVGRAVQPPTAAGTTGAGTRAGATAPTTGPGAMPGGPTQPVPVTLAGGGLTLTFTCPNCGNNVRQQSNLSDTTTSTSGQRR